MKKIVSSVLMLSLASVMLFGLAGCGDKNKGNDTPVDTNPPVTEPVTPPDSTPDVGEEIVVTVEDIVNTLKNAYGENYLPSQMLEPDVFEQLTGLTSEDYSEYYAEMPMISTHVDSLFVVKAPGNTENVAEKLSTYRQGLLESGLQYPMNVPKIESSVVEVYDDYVVFMMLGGYPENEVTDSENESVELPTEEDTKLADFYTEQTNKGLDALSLLFEIGYVEPVEDAIDNEPEGTPDSNVSDVDDPNALVDTNTSEANTTDEGAITVNPDAAVNPDTTVNSNETVVEPELNEAPSSADFD